MISVAKPCVGDTEIDRVTEVIESGLLADGSEVRTFEREFATHCNTERGVATSNGTTALHAALEALEIGDGDHVLTTPFSFIATANAIRHVGATPVFADIDPLTYNLDPDAAARVAEDETRSIDAILVVHLYGLPAEMDAFSDLADDLGVPLIEDCAQAHAGTYDGRPVGSFGDAACFSFYPTKNMTTGEGGIVVTNREDVATRLERFVNHGRTDSNVHVTPGHNFRLTNIAAAIGRVQLERLPEFVDRRRENARRLTTGLADTPLETPFEPDGTRHVYHQYTVRTPAAERESIRADLADHDIGSGIYYPSCIHDQPAYDGFDPDVPVAEQAASEVLSLPVHPAVSDDDIDHILEVLTTDAT